MQEPELSIKSLLPMAPWDPKQAGAIVDQIGQLRPFLRTPLVQAMWKAAKQDLESATGLKTLLVLTDGNDTELEKFKPKYNPSRLSVKDFIVAGFKPLGITVNMVFFTPASRAEGDRRCQESLRSGPGPARTSRQLQDGQGSQGADRDAPARPDPEAHLSDPQARWHARR